MTVRHDHKMDPADSPFASEGKHLAQLWDYCRRIIHAVDNYKRLPEPRAGRFSCPSGGTRRLVFSASAAFFTKQERPQQRSSSFPSDTPASSSTRKQQSRRWRAIPPPEFGTTARPAVVSVKDTDRVASDFVTSYSGAECFVMGDSSPCDFPTSPAPLLSVQPVQPPIQSATQLSSPLESLQPIFQSMAQSVVQLMAQSQSSLTPLQEAVRTPPILNCFPSAHSKQRDTPVPQTLAMLGTRSRASPEARLQPAANSGPLEAKLPAKDRTRLSLPEQGQCSVQLQFSSCVPEAPVPTGFGPVFAGGTEEPVQPSLSSAASTEGSQEPLQPAAFAGGTEESVQLPTPPAAAAPSPPAAAAAGAAPSPPAAAPSPPAAAAAAAAPSPPAAAAPSPPAAAAP
ncbi:nascent polypeptide-associated complex subunit alpha, muscle-specific form-like [Oreochromis niloticus]|uniref:nascent polypeptide-associated complex subunit alpha, muscle-specific form-like n=1 Tax=Oreochromis niloticus TaxID=8128 RepID=UPI0009054421|nr:nascent polypeptide-associated complex subunit alpha, muscle-specific form-like [Oreochromis niloticus]CAI5654953.1 unnamed protein product [Mustela putorius furo]